MIGNLVTYWSDGTQSWRYLYTSCLGGGGGGGGGGSGQPSIQSVEDFTEDGFPPNPVDGQTHMVYYPSGNLVEFTYNSEFGTWMLPEVTIVDEDTQYVIESYTMTPNPGYAGSLMTLGAIALAEPTPIGEIIWVGAAIVYGIVYVVDLTNDTLVEIEQENLDFCIETFVSCTEVTPYAACDDCLHYCRAQGGWPSGLCPGVVDLD